MKVSGKILVFILILGGLFAPRCGATVYHSNGSAANVQALHNAALNGDTITLPAGAFTWSSAVTISKAITLQGRGIGGTVIRDAVQSGPLMTWNLVANQASRVTGIEFRNGGRTAQASSGIIPINGITYDNRTMRVDHCKFDHLNGTLLVPHDVIGVIDHNLFLESGREAIQVWNARWRGRTFGDGSWADTNHFGTSRFLFIEDNTFYGGPHAIDAYAGARYVARYNTFVNSKHGGHGTESSGRNRGMRAIESYNNRFIGNGNSGTLIDVRSGVALVHDNVVSGGTPGLTRTFKLACHRMFHRFPFWGGADGRSPWDVNQTGGPFYSGTASSGGTLLQWVTGAGAGWTPNQWTGYSIVKTSNLGANNFSQITANNSNTITFLKAGGYGANMSFASGHTFSIYKVNHVLDQPGRSGGSLITGNPPVPPPGWNNQITDPCYEWNNMDTSTGQNVPVHFSPAQPIIRLNEHYFNNTQAPGYTPYVYPHPLTLLPTGPARAVVSDFNGDGSPDYVLQTARTHQTAIWYLDNNVYVDFALGPTLTPWRLAAVADFNHDSHGDYSLFNPVTGLTGIYYLDNNVYTGSAWGPTFPPVWTLVGAADFNGDSKPDYLLYNVRSGQTGIYYLDGNIYGGSAFGPTIPHGWELVGAADFNGDSKPDYALYNVNTRQTGIYYLDNNVYTGSAWGPTLPPVWTLVGTADFNGDNSPDYLLYNVNTQQTGIYYLNNNVYAGSAWGPTLPPGWSFFGP
jgi:hypothetical protein